MHDPFAVAREMAEARIREHEAAVVHAEGRVSDIERTMAALKQERLAWATVITYEKRLAQQAREFLATLQTAPEPQQLPPPRRALSRHLHRTLAGRLHRSQAHAIAALQLRAPGRRAGAHPGPARRARLQ